MEDYLCTSTTCSLCVYEIRDGVYCHGNFNDCDGECTYLYDEPEQPPINPPIEDSSIVVLINPADDYYLENPAQVTFSFKIIKKTQKARFSICELVVDGEVVNSRSTPQFTLPYDLKYSLTNGLHNWRIYCTEAESDGEPQDTELNIGH